MEFSELKRLLAITNTYNLHLCIYIYFRQSSILEMLISQVGNIKGNSSEKIENFNFDFHSTHEKLK